MKYGSNDISCLFMNISKAISKHGLNVVNKTVRRLVESKGESYETDLVDFIVNCISKEYNVDFWKNENISKRGDYSSARRLCYYLIKKHLKLTLKAIKDMIPVARSESNIKNQIDELILDPDLLRTKDQRINYEIYLRVSSKIEEYKSSYDVANMFIDETIEQ